MTASRDDHELVALSSNDLAQAAMCWAVLRRIWPAEQNGFVRFCAEPTADPEAPDVTAFISRWHTLEDCLHNEYKPIRSKLISGATVEMTVEGACAMRALLKDTIMAAASGDMVDCETLSKAVEVFDAVLTVSDVTG